MRLSHWSPRPVTQVYSVAAAQQVTTANAPQLPGWVTVSEAADLLGVSRQTVHQMLWAGEFETLHRVGPGDRRGVLVVAREEVERLAVERPFPRSPSSQDSQDSPGS